MANELDALQFELHIEATPAESTLTRLETTLEKINDYFVKFGTAGTGMGIELQVATKATEELLPVFQAYMGQVKLPVIEQMPKFIDQLQKANDYADYQRDAWAEASGQLGTFGEVLENNISHYDAINGHIDTLHTQMLGLVRAGEAESAEFKDISSELAEWLEFQKQLEPFIGEKHLERVKEEGRSYRQRNVYTKEFQDLVKEINAEQKQFADSLTGSMFAVGGMDVRGLLSRTGLAMALLVDPLMTHIKLQEDYHTAAFRAAGSADQLAKNVGKLRNSLGATTKEIHEAQQALIQTGMGAEAYRDQLVGLTEQTVQFARITGVSNARAGEFAARMTQLTGESQMAGHAFTYMATAMEKGLITQQDVDATMQSMTQHGARLQAVFGQGAVKRFGEGMTQLAAAARKAGVDVSHINQLMNDLTTNSVKFIAVLGSDALYKDPARNLQKLVNEWGTWEKRFATIPPGLRPEIMASVTGVTIEQAKAITEAKKSGEDYIKTMNDQIQLQDSYKDAQETFMRTVVALHEAIGGLAQTLIGALAPVLKAIGVALKVIIWPLRIVADSIGWLTANVPVLGPFLEFVFGAVMVVMILRWTRVINLAATSFMKAGTSVVTAAKSMYQHLSNIKKTGLAGFFQNSLTGIKNWAKGIKDASTKTGGLTGAAKDVETLGKTAGKSAAGLDKGAAALENTTKAASKAKPTIGARVKALGKALHAFLTQMAKVPWGGIIKTLVLIGGIALAFGLLAWAMSKLPPETLIGMGIAMIGFAALLFAASKLLEAGAVGMLIFAGVALAIGVAIAIAAFGVSLLVKAFTGLIEAVGGPSGLLSIAAGFLLFAAGIAAIAFAAWLIGPSIPMLALFGVALMALWFTLWWVNKQFAKFADSMEKIGKGMAQLSEASANIGQISSAIKTLTEVESGAALSQVAMGLMGIGIAGWWLSGVAGTIERVAEALGKVPSVSWVSDLFDTINNTDYDHLEKVGESLYYFASYIMGASRMLMLASVYGSAAVAFARERERTAEARRAEETRDVTIRQRQENRETNEILKGIRTYVHETSNHLGVMSEKDDVRNANLKIIADRLNKPQASQVASSDLNDYSIDGIA